MWSCAIAINESHRAIIMKDKHEGFNKKFLFLRFTFFFSLLSLSSFSHLFFFPSLIFICTLTPLCSVSLWLYLFTPSVFSLIKKVLKNISLLRNDNLTWQCIWDAVVNWVNNYFFAITQWILELKGLGKIAKQMSSSKYCVTAQRKVFPILIQKCDKKHHYIVLSQNFSDVHTKLQWKAIRKILIAFSPNTNLVHFFCRIFLIIVISVLFSYSLASSYFILYWKSIVPVSKYLLHSLTLSA